MWGSDMPNVERFCTYGQSLEYLRRYCDFLPASDMDRILGDNAARLTAFPQRESSHLSSSGSSLPPHSICAAAILDGR